VLPQWLASVSRRFRTPWLSLVVNTVIALALLWTRRFDYVLNIALVAMFLIYGLHSAAMIALPFIRPALYKTAEVKLRPALIVLFGAVSVASMAYLTVVTIASDINRQNSLPAEARGMTLWQLLLIWVGIGTVLYGLARWEGRRSGFDYKAQLMKDWSED
jgi:amino acid transporter